MNISYNWLKEYVDFELTAQEVADALTSEGLEVGCVEEVQPVKGGLQGLVIGEVLTCVPHPDCMRCAERGSRTESGGGHAGLQIV